MKSGVSTAKMRRHGLILGRFLSRLCLPSPGYRPVQGRQTKKRFVTLSHGRRLLHLFLYALQNHAFAAVHQAIPYF